MTFEKLRTLAEAEIKKTIKALPPELQEPADIPVILETVPSEEDVRDGIDEDVLGLFVGASLAEAAGVEGEAAHIILYLENIWDEADEDGETFLEEVRITFLHELGHYLNLDEGELEERGLA